MGYADTAVVGPIAIAMASLFSRWWSQILGKDASSHVGDRRGDWLLGLGFWLAALPLYGVNLGGAVLRDWDEGTVAQVAREIAQSSAGFWEALLHPTLWAQAYVNKPPLMHGLVAVLFRLGGESDLAARLPGAMLTALSVPLLYWVGRELFVTRRPAVFGAIAYLTLLPMVRHGRLAMLDGAVVCFYLLTIVAGLRSRRDARWSLGVGLGMGLMCLTKGVLGILLGGLLLGFLAWDTPRMLRSGYLWSGLILGLAPAMAWYGNQTVSGTDDFVQRGLVDQALKRLWQPVENHRGSVLYYVGELLEWGWPWVMFLPWGVSQAWRERSLSWGRLILVLGGGYFGVISLAQTKLPWYIMPLYPLVALAIGPVLADCWDRFGGVGVEPYTPGRSPRGWLGLLGLLVGIALAGGLYFSLGSEAAIGLAIPFWFLVAGMGLSAWLLWRRDAQWILVLTWGWYLAIFALMASPYWVFELKDGVAVKPMAAVIRSQVEDSVPVYTTNAIERPSLSFYSGTRVIPICPLPTALYPTEPFYLWLRDGEQELFGIEDSELDGAEGWQLQGPVVFSEPTGEDEMRSRVINFCQSS